ncbi:ABC transporter substrate-binding protein [Leisingera sp. ANG-DT]|uniref:ABC transporter substrate-binding protein n=1 Tax=Leisingera sp. ANG-DT TaxID=1577897 RepID=UPI00057ECFB6|nr:ABC transporter substrate-binding protein [Leisingera sp. ANG-DT]KIC17935.1 peptide ABC transporter substrate-binding protein [Leisingera sp. ANG-DT]
MSDIISHYVERAVKGFMTRREFIGRLGALGVAAASANSLLASAARAEGPKKGGLIRSGLQGGASTDSLDPALAASSVANNVLTAYGDLLVEVSPQGEIVPRLAETVEASADAKTWTFKIRQGMEFHNGKTLTPEDVLKTMQRHSNEDSQSGALGIMRGIESMKADGDYFSVTLETPNADLPYLMADYHLVVQPGGGMDAPAAGIGTGPYTVEVNEPGARHAFKKFANYWDADRGHADEIEILVLNDDTARTAALQSGQVHFINRVSPKIANLLGRAPGLRIESISGRGHYCFLMHCDTAPFASNDLRMALKLAVDRQEMVDKVLRGYGSVGNDMPINAAYPLFSGDIEQRSYDPDQARHYYQKSGHDGPVVLKVSDNAFPGAVDAAALFQQSAAKAGIPLQIERVPSDGYWSEVWNKEPFCASYWGGRPVQDQMFSTAYKSDADWNDTRFKREDFDALLLQAKGELDTAKRTALYREMGLMVRDEGGAIIPMFNDFIDGVSEQVGGWENDPGGGMMYDGALVKTWLL